MKISFGILTKLLLIVLFLTSLNGLAFSNVDNSLKIAIVDVQKVVQNYDKVNVLKENQKTKLNELQKFVENARKEIAAEKDQQKQKQLEDKYNKELQDKKQNIDEEYKKKLAVIDADITKAINKIAKNENYELVFDKRSVLMGGQDITDKIIKSL